MPKVNIRPARLTDLAPIARLTRQVVKRDYAFYSPAIQGVIIRRYTGRALASSMVRGKRLVLVARTEPKLIGVLVTTANSDGVAVVHWLAVHEADRSQGVGTKLLTEFEKRLKGLPVHKIMLWTEVASLYYEKLGWAKEAVLPNHWWGQEVSLLAKYLK